MKAILMLLAAASLFAQGPGGGRGPSAPKPKPAPFTRLKSGEPDMQGYWNTKVLFTAFDLEAHPKASFEVPAGPGVVVDPPDGKIPYQPWAAAKKKDLIENHPYEDPQAHCMLSGVPRQLYTPFGFQILQPKDHVILAFEAFHAFRIIPLKGGPHIAANIKQFEGDARGHWEKDTLVVDVTNLDGRTWFDMGANFHSEELHVVERYAMVDSDTIRYEATLEDPKVFTRSWKIAFDLGRNKEPGYEQMEYACVEGERDLQHYTETEGAKPKR